MQQRTRDFLDEIASDMEFLDSREDQLLTMRDYGSYLAAMPDESKTDDNLVPGCASATHITCDIQPDSTLHYQGSSESFISRGYLYILITAFNGCTPDEIMQEAEPLVQEFVKRAQIRKGLVPSRANAFENIFYFMKRKAVEALAHQA